MTRISILAGVAALALAGGGAAFGEDVPAPELTTGYRPTVGPDLSAAETVPGIPIVPGILIEPGIPVTPGVPITPGIPVTPGILTTPGTDTTPGASATVLGEFWLKAQRERTP